MSVDDPTIPTPPPAATPALVGPDLAQWAVDQLRPSVETAATKVATEAAQQATTNATAAIQILSQGANRAASDAKQVATDLQVGFEAHKAYIEQRLAQVGASTLDEAATDRTLQRNLVYGAVGTALLMAVIILIAYLLGNSQAAHIWGAILGLPGAAVLWISSAGAKLPSRQVVKS